MGSEAAEPLRDLIRAYAYSGLPALREEERERWNERYAAQSAELGFALPLKLYFGKKVTWRFTVASLRMLRAALPDPPGPLEARYSQQERRLIEAYAEAHVDVLRAVSGTGGR